MRLEQVAGGAYVCPEDPGEPGGPVPARRVSVTDEEGRMLAEMVAGLEVLEIGTGLGVSTRWMAGTARRVYTVDVDEWVRAEVWPGLAGLENVVVCKTVAEVGEVDAAFIDGCHEAGPVERDARDALARVRPGGLVLFHDAGSDQVRGGMAAVIPLEAVEVLETEFQIGRYRVG